MRELIISEAPLARIAATTKDVVEDIGGVLSSHTHHATRFDHLRITDDTWSRSGYVGTYQEHGSSLVRVRVRVWASNPRRFFLGSLYLGLAEAVLFFLMALFQVPPPANVWILTAILTFLAIGLSLLTYSTSWAASKDLEETLVRRIGSEAQSDPEVPGDVYTLGGWQEHRQDVVEQALARIPEEEKAPSGLLAGSTLLQRVLSGGGGDEDASNAGDPAEKRRGIGARLPFGGSKTADDGDGTEPPEADEDERAEGASTEGPTEEEASGLIARFRRGHASEEDTGTDNAPDGSAGWRSKLPFGGGSGGGDHADEGADQADEDGQPRPGLLGRLPFGRSEGSDDEPDPEA